MYFWRISFFILIYGLQSLWADEVRIPAGSFQEFEKKTTLSQYDWLKQFSLELQDDFCSKESYFSRCTEIEKNKKCSDIYVDALNKCVKTANLPSEIQIYGNGIQFGIDIGSCVESSWKSNPQIHWKESAACLQRGSDEK